MCLGFSVFFELATGSILFACLFKKEYVKIPRGVDTTVKINTNAISKCSVPSFIVTSFKVANDSISVSIPKSIIEIPSMSMKIYIFLFLPIIVPRLQAPLFPS